MTAHAPSAGSIFAGRYRIVRHIAAGGMGDVYEAVHLETERSCALKLMLPHILANDTMRQRFRREARVASRIPSDHIVAVSDAGIDDATGIPFLVMELLHGEELARRLERVGRLSPDEVVTILHQTALALDKTHKAGIVHRDLKPENLFVTARDDGSPHVKVLDFGIAKILADSSACADTTHETIGTPLYMAPEQFRAGGPVSGAADIYSIAMIAYTMLVGVTYWAKELDEGASVLVLASIAMGGPSEPASARARQRGVELPAAFDAWFARATALAPEARFQGALLAVSALAKAMYAPWTGRTAAAARSPVRPALSFVPGCSSSGTRNDAPPAGLESVVEPRATRGEPTPVFVAMRTVTTKASSRTRRSAGMALLAVALSGIVTALVFVSRRQVPVQAAVVLLLEIPRSPVDLAEASLNASAPLSLPEAPAPSALALPSQEPRSPKARVHSKGTQGRGHRPEEQETKVKPPSTPLPAKEELPDPTRVLAKRRLENL